MPVFLPAENPTHFQNVAITTKAGLLGNLRNLKWFADCDCGDILPRGYDLSVESDVLVSESHRHRKARSKNNQAVRAYAHSRKLSDALVVGISALASLSMNFSKPRLYMKVYLPHVPCYSLCPGESRSTYQGL